MDSNWNPKSSNSFTIGQPQRCNYHFTSQNSLLVSYWSLPLLDQVLRKQSLCQQHHYPLKTQKTCTDFRFHSRPVEHIFPWAAQVILMFSKFKNHNAHIDSGQSHLDCNSLSSPSGFSNFIGSNRRTLPPRPEREKHRPWLGSQGLQCRHLAVSPSLFLCKIFILYRCSSNFIGACIL